MAVYVVGHKNPDTDSVAAAIAVADLMNKSQSMGAIAAAQGPLNPESAFVLEKFGVAAPEIVTDATDKKIILVDHSDLAQSLENLSKGELIGIYDHHKLGDVTTSNPLDILVKAVGCSCTVVKMMYDCAKVEISKPMAGIMLCAILSDTVMFKSPTCTPEDKKACEKLAKIAGVADMMALGMEMFKVKSAVDGTPIRDLVFRDYKDFSMSGTGVGIGQLEVVDLAILDKYKADLQADIAKVKSEKGLHSVFLLLTDIMKEGTEMLIVSDDVSVVEKAFGVKPTGTSVWLPGVMSRKKDVVPKFEKVFGA